MLISNIFLIKQEKVMKKTMISLAVLAAINGQTAVADGRVMAEILVEGSAPVKSSKAMAGGPLDAEELTGLGATGDGGELLTHVPGVSAVRIGGHGFDPVIRGQSQNRLNVMLDGAYVHAGCSSRMDPPSSYAALETYDKVTVIKGGQTVEFGGGGGGATVLFERDTQPPEEGDSVRGKAGATYKDNGDFKSVYADGTFGSSDGYLRLSGIVSDAGDYEDGRGTKVASGFKSKNANLVAGFNPDVDSNVEISLEHNLEEDVLYEGLPMDTTETTNDAARLRYQNSGFKVEIYQSEVDHDMDNYTFALRGAKSGNTAMRTVGESDTQGVRFSNAWQSDMVSWKVGADYKKNERYAESLRGGDSSNGTVSTIFRNYMWPDAEVEQAGLFMESDFSLNERNQLSTGLRYEYVDPSASKAGTTVTAGAGITAGRNSADLAYNHYYGKTSADADSENNVSGFVRLSRKLESDGAVYGSLSRSVRTADGVERFVWKDTGSSDWVGNPALDPEKQHQLEVGGEFVISGMTIATSIFYADVDDYILKTKAHGESGVLQSDSQTVYRNIDATRWGYELDLSQEWGDHFYGGLSISYVRAENDTDNRSIGQTPPLNGALTVGYAKGDWDIGTRLRFADKQTRVEADSSVNSGTDTGQTPGYGVMDLYGTMFLQNDAELKIGVDNIFDKTYAEHLNPGSAVDGTSDQVNEPGRSIWVKANIRF